MATSTISPNSVIEPSPCFPSPTPETTFFVPITNPFWVNGFVGLIRFPPWIDFRICSEKPPRAILNQCEIEWSTSPTLYGGNGSWYAATTLMAPKPITPWVWALVFHGGMVQGSRVLLIERHLQVLLLGRVLVLDTIIGRRCSHVVKHKLPSNHILVVR